MGDDNDATVHDLAEGAEALTTDQIDADATAARIPPLGDEVMSLLAQHVPLALLADLAAPSDRVSSEILRSEGLPEDAWWEAPTDEVRETGLGTEDPSAAVESKKFTTA